MPEDYGEFFQAFSDVFTRFGEFWNDIISPQASGLGGAFAIVLLLVLLIAIMILAFRRGTRWKF